jgi:hypothetical protein
MKATRHSFMSNVATFLIAFIVVSLVGWTIFFVLELLNSDSDNIGLLLLRGMFMFAAPFFLAWSLSTMLFKYRPMIWLGGSVAATLVGIPLWFMWLM